MYGGVAYEAKHRRTGTSWNDPVAWLQVRSLPPSLAKERVNVTAVLFGAAVSVPFCVKRAYQGTPWKTRWRDSEPESPGPQGLTLQVESNLPGRRSMRP